MANQIFKETQRFNPSLLWIIILICFVPFHIFGLRELVNESANGNNLLGGDTVQAVVIGMVVLYLIVILLLQMKLETKIDAHSIQYRYPPVINQWRRIPQNEIRSVEGIKYAPWNIGGWGIKNSWNGWTFNARGNKGIMIKMKKGKQLLIGTQQVVQAKDAINNLMRQEREIDYGQ